MFQVFIYFQFILFKQLNAVYRIYLDEFVVSYITNLDPKLWNQVSILPIISTASNNAWWGLEYAGYLSCYGVRYSHQTNILCMKVNVIVILQF